jgi:hypothetical protein
MLRPLQLPQMDAPDKGCYQQLVQELLGPALAPEQQQEVLASLPAQLAGLLPGDVCGVAADAVAAAAAQALAAPAQQAAAEASGSGGDGQLQVTSQHVEQALARVKARTATEIGAPQVRCLACWAGRFAAGGHGPLGPPRHLLRLLDTLPPARARATPGAQRPVGRHRGAGGCQASHPGHHRRRHRQPV